MKVSLKWLRDYVKVALPIEGVGRRLTMAGLEVTGSTRVGGEWQGVWVGLVEEVLPHPNADRLRLARVRVGGESLTVVCGAPNVAPGQKVAFAKVGAQLIDGHTGQPVVLKEARIRGVVSAGMVCSEKELGLGESHEGILVLPAQAPVGTPLSEYLGDVILDIDITPNRPDCLSILGIAREVAAVTGERVTPPPLDYPEPDPPIEAQAGVEIADPDLCPRYCAALITGVKIAPSPPWMQERLLGYGMRPINNVVDVTNYVMIEMGQPLHAFDFHTLRARKIIVRRARPGETLTSLDGAERALSLDMLVIADAQGAVAVAGVMGGLDTEVTPGTTAILLEAANFSYSSIRRTAAALRMRTEASLRFERGLSAELVPPNLRRAVRLLLEVAGGRAARGILDVYPGRQERPPISLPLSEIPRLLGLEVRKEEVIRVLTSLGFEWQESSPSRLEVRVPYWRSDVRLSADLVEEVARVVGYDRLPTTILSGTLPPRSPNPSLKLREQVRDLLVGWGLQEVITYSLTSAERLSSTHSPSGLQVANPLSQEQESLRTSLRPGLLSALGANQKRETEGVRLFEVGRVFLPRPGELPDEREMLGAVLWGGRGESSWTGRGQAADFYEAKGLAQALLCRLGVEATFSPGADPLLHPSRQAAITVAGAPAGLLGEVHPIHLPPFGLNPSVYLLELELEKLLPQAFRPTPYRPLPRFPAVVRDLALVVDEAVPAQRLQEIIARSPSVTQVALFDLYRGAPIPPGKKSLAFRLYYQSPSRTLTDQEVDQEQGAILEGLSRQVGAVLRS